MADLALTVNGKAYGGWTSARVTRGIEAVAGSFELDATDRWAGQAEPWPIHEEDECSLAINGGPVITGYVDRRSLVYGGREHRLSVGGRDRTAALVDCSVDLGVWEFRQVPLLKLAQRLAEPFGLAVALQPGITLPPPLRKLSVNPGDTAFDAIEQACRMVGLLPVCDGAGGLLLTRSATARATTDLVEGENILAGAADYDASGRFRRYVVVGQQAGTDLLSGEAAARVKGEARDANVRRGERVLLVRPESGATGAYVKQRAAWEATVRAARSRRVRIAVQGWQQGDGALWPVNALVRVRSPFLGIDGDLLITQATYTLESSGGTTTELSLMPPEAFQPEPNLPPRKEPGNNFGALLGP